MLFPLVSKCFSNRGVVCLNSSDVAAFLIRYPLEIGNWCMIVEPVDGLEL